jgi:hypothetical protein
LRCHDERMLEQRARRIQVALLAMHGREQV